MKNDLSSLDTLPDEALMNEYRLGNHLAFEALYQRHRDKVYGYLCAQLASSGCKSEDANEVFQECFLRIHRFRDRYDPTFPFVPWLFTVCRNSMIDFFRHRKRQQSFSENANLERIAAETEPTVVGEALATLPAHESLVVNMHFLQGYSFAEVAEHLKIQPAAARKMSSRAIMKLRKLFARAS